MPSEGEAHRLHPLSPLFRAGSAARSLLVPGLAVLLFSRGSNYEIWLMILFVPAVVATMAQYLSYRYRLDRDELRVRQGIITRQERHIPYARIQNIDLVQNPLHRMLGVAEVRVETAGGNEPEAVMRVLSLEAVDRMRRRVFSDRRPADAAAGDEQAPPADRVLQRLDARDLLLFGIISNKGMVMVAAAMGLLWQSDVLPNWVDGSGSALVDRLGKLVPGGGWLTRSLALVAVVLLALLLMRLLSVVWSFTKFHGFQLRRSGDDLRAEYGLVTRISKTLPRHRIQVLSMNEGPLHRWFGRAAVQVTTAGGGGGEESGAGRMWLAPVMDKSGVDGLLAETLPGIDLGSLAWMPISSRARARILRRCLFLWVPATAFACWRVTPWMVVPALAVAVLLVVHATLSVKHAGYAVGSGGVACRSGWWNRRLSVARFGKLQALELTASPFDRRNGMASVRVDTAGAGLLGHGIEIRLLDAPVALDLLERLSVEAGRAEFRW